MIHLYATTKQGELLEHRWFEDWFRSEAEAVDLRTKYADPKIYRYDPETKEWSIYYWKVTSPYVSIGIADIYETDLPKTVRTLHMLEAE